MLSNIWIDELVIGDTSEAFIFALDNELPIIVNGHDGPFYDLSEKQKKNWTLYLSYLMLKGRLVGGTNVSNIFLDQDEIKIFYGRNKVLSIDYNKVYVFDDKNVNGLTETKKQDRKYHVIDQFQKVRRGMSWPEKITGRTWETRLYDNIEHDFIKKISVLSLKEIYVFSELKESQLQQFEYSDTMIKFFVQEFLKEKGFAYKYIAYDLEVLRLSPTPRVKLQSVERVLWPRPKQYKSIGKIEWITQEKEN